MADDMTMMWDEVADIGALLNELGDEEFDTPSLSLTDGGPGFSPKKNVAGLRLIASGLGWSAGDGPGVEGPGASVVLAAAGRTVALADLQGDGVDVLRARIAGRAQ